MCYPVTGEMIQASDQVKMRLTSELINSISRVLQKLVKNFNGTPISTYFVFPATGAFPVTSILHLNDSGRIILSFGSPL